MSNTAQTAEDLVADSSAMIVKILRKQMNAILEQMEEEWRKENYRANCLYEFVATVLVNCQRGPIDQGKLLALADDYSKRYCERPVIVQQLRPAQEGI